MVGTELVLADLEVLLHRPPQACDSDQGVRGDRPPFGRVAGKVGLVGRSGWAHEQVVARAGGGHLRPAVGAVSFGHWPARGPVPRPGRHQFQGVISADLTAGGQGDGERAWDPEHVAGAAVLAEGPQGGVAAARPHRR